VLERVAGLGGLLEAAVDFAVNLAERRQLIDVVYAAAAREHHASGQLNDDPTLGPVDDTSAGRNFLNGDAAAAETAVNRYRGR
jgi:hypothetical protein